MTNEELEFNNDEEVLTLYDNEGNEVLYRKLLQFYHPEFKKEYLILAEESNFSDEDGDIELIPMISTDDEEGQLLPVETDEEWDMIEEVVNTQMDESEE